MTVTVTVTVTLTLTLTLTCLGSNPATGLVSQKLDVTLTLTQP